MEGRGPTRDSRGSELLEEDEVELGDLGMGGEERRVWSSFRSRSRSRSRFREWDDKEVLRWDLLLRCGSGLLDGSGDEDRLLFRVWEVSSVRFSFLLLRSLEG